MYDKWHFSDAEGCLINVAYWFVIIIGSLLSLALVVMVTMAVAGVRGAG